MDVGDTLQAVNTLPATGGGRLPDLEAGDLLAGSSPSEEGRVLLLSECSVHRLEGDFWHLVREERPRDDP